MKCYARQKLSVLIASTLAIVIGYFWLRTFKNKSKKIKVTILYETDNLFNYFSFNSSSILGMSVLSITLLVFAPVPYANTGTMTPV